MDNMFRLNATTPISSAHDTEEKNYTALLFAIIPALTIFGNGLVIASVWQNKSLRTPTNFLIVSLAVADFLVALCVMPFAVYVEVENSVWKLPKFLCNIYISADVCASTASILNLAAISWDRYVAINRPLVYARRSKSRSQGVAWLVVGVWLASAAIGAPVLLGLNDLHSTDYCEFTNAAYIVASSLGSFYAPCLLILALYGVVLHTLGRRRRSHAVVRRKNAPAPAPDPAPTLAPAASGVIRAEEQDLGEWPSWPSEEESSSGATCAAVVAKNRWSRGIALIFGRWRRKDLRETKIDTNDHRAPVPSPGFAHNISEVNHLNSFLPYIDHINTSSHAVLSVVDVAIDCRSCASETSSCRCNDSPIVKDYGALTQTPDDRTARRKNCNVCHSSPSLICQLNDNHHHDHHHHDIQDHYHHNHDRHHHHDHHHYQPKVLTKTSTAMFVCNAKKHVVPVDEPSSRNVSTCTQMTKRSAIKAPINSMLKKIRSRSRLTGGNESRYLRKEARATNMLAVVLAVFLLCWVPFFTCHLTNSICLLRFSNRCIPFSAFFYTTWLGYMNSFMNPLIYTVFNVEYRKAFYRLLCLHSVQQRTSSLV